MLLHRKKKKNNAKYAHEICVFKSHNIFVTFDFYSDRTLSFRELYKTQVDPRYKYKKKTQRTNTKKTI